VSGKNNKILPIPETMQGISTSAESKEERSKKNKSKKTSDQYNLTYFALRSSKLEIPIEKGFKITNTVEVLSIVVVCELKM
jgi:hypothetical protein